MDEVIGVIVENLYFEKFTPNKVRFAEQGAAARDGNVGYIYIPKKTLSQHGWDPQKVMLRVTVEAIAI